MRRARSASSPMRRRLGRGVAALAFFAFLAATIVAQHRYFHCASMDESSLSSCCPRGAHAVSNGDLPTIDDDRCCETKQFAALGTAIAVSSRALSPATLVSLAASAPRAAPPRSAAWAPGSSDARAGPFVHRPRDYRLRLMISLT